VFCNFFENDEIKLKELKLKKKRKQIELENANNEKKPFDFYNANLEKAKELMGKFV
jgi:ribosomal protein S1